MIEVFAGVIATLLTASVGLLGWILLKINTISTMLAVVENRLLAGDQQMTDHEDRIRHLEKIHAQRN